MEWVDLIIIGLIFLSVLTGFIRGFVKELMGILVWLFGLWIAYHYAHLLEPFVKPYLHDETATRIAAFLIVLIMTVIMGGLINALLGFLLKRTGLGGTDRLLGVVFGFIRGIFIVSLMLLVIKMTGIIKDGTFTHSRLVNAFTPIVSWMYDLMPEFLKHFDLNKEKNIIREENTKA